MESTAKKPWKVKATAYTLGVVALIGAEHNCHLAQKAGNAYTSVKNGIVDVLTTDAGEAAEDFTAKLAKTEDATPYARELGDAAYAAASRMPEGEREKATRRIIGTMQPASAGSVTIYAAQTLPNGEKGRTLVQILKTSDGVTKAQVFEYAANSVTPEQKIALMQSYVKNLNLEQARKLDDILESKIDFEKDKEPAWYQKAFRTIGNVYQGLKEKIAGKTYEPEAAATQKTGKSEK